MALLGGHADEVWSLFLSSLSWPGEIADLQWSRVSFLEIVITYEVWAERRFDY